MVALPRNALIKFATNFVTDHNRQPADISVERIEKATRTANGTMRSYFIADKHTLTLTWSSVPGPTNKTVDGNWGADAIEAFYNATRGGFTVLITMITGTSTYQMRFSDFSKTLSSRGAYDMYDLNVTLEEI